MTYDETKREISIVKVGLTHAEINYIISRYRP